MLQLYHVLEPCQINIWHILVAFGSSGEDILVYIIINL